VLRALHAKRGRQAADPGARSAILYGSDKLTMRLTSFPLPCTDPEQEAPDGLCGYYNVKITFAPSLLQEGPVDTSTGMVELFRSLPVEVSNALGVCGTVRHEGEFSGSEKLTFVSVEEPFVIFKIEELDPELVDGHDLNGLHMVKRCP
jgi:hypothetical protein